MLNQNGSSVSPTKKAANFPFTSKTPRAIFKAIPAKHTYFTIVFCCLYTTHAFLLKRDKRNVMKK